MRTTLEIPGNTRLLGTMRPWDNHGQKGGNFDTRGRGGTPTKCIQHPAEKKPNRG